MRNGLIKNSAMILILTLGLASCGGGSKPLTRDGGSLPPATTQQDQQDRDQLSAEDDRTPRQEIRIGFLVPLSGPDGPIGQAMLNAATLALFDSHDKRLVLLPHDTQGTAEGATEAMTSLVAQQPDLILGPLFSHSIAAIKPLAQNAGINVIGFSSDHTVAGNGVFLMNFRLEEQIRRVMRYSSDQGYARYAALVPETSYGTRALEVFGASVMDLERDMVTVEFYPADSTKLVPPVKNIANYDHRRNLFIREMAFLDSLGDEDDFASELKEDIKNAETLGTVKFDALLLPEGGAMLTTLAAWVSYYEIDPTKVKLIGTGLWDDEMLFHEPQLYGGWFAAPDHDVSDKFLARYRDSYSKDSPRLSTLAYDAMALTATLVRHDAVPNFSAENITDENGFTGVEGLFRFTQDGLIERGLAVYEVTANAFIVVDPAPTHFIDQDRETAVRNLTAAVTPEDAPEDHSAEASLGLSPANEPAPAPPVDTRPFPYNPVQKDALNTENQ